MSLNTSPEGWVSARDTRTEVQNLLKNGAGTPSAPDNETTQPSQEIRPIIQDGPLPAEVTNPTQPRSATTYLSATVSPVTRSNPPYERSLTPQKRRRHDYHFPRIPIPHFSSKGSGSSRRGRGRKIALGVAALALAGTVLYLSVRDNQRYQPATVAIAGESRKQDSMQSADMGVLDAIKAKNYRERIVLSGDEARLLAYDDSLKNANTLAAQKKTTAQDTARYAANTDTTTYKSSAILAWLAARRGAALDGLVAASDWFSAIGNKNDVHATLTIEDVRRAYPLDAAVQQELPEGDIVMLPGTPVDISAAVDTAGLQHELFDVQPFVAAGGDTSTAAGSILAYNGLEEGMEATSASPDVTFPYRATRSGSASTSSESSTRPYRPTLADLRMADREDLRTALAQEEARARAEKEQQEHRDPVSLGESVYQWADNQDAAQQPESTSSSTAYRLTIHVKSADDPTFQQFDNVPSIQIERELRAQGYLIADFWGKDGLWETIRPQVDSDGDKIVKAGSYDVDFSEAVTNGVVYRFDPEGRPVGLSREALAGGRYVVEDGNTAWGLVEEHFGRHMPNRFLYGADGKSGYLSKVTVERGGGIIGTALDIDEGLRPADVLHLPAMNGSRAYSSETTEPVHSSLADPEIYRQTDPAQQPLRAEVVMAALGAIAAVPSRSRQRQKRGRTPTAGSAPDPQTAPSHVLTLGSYEKSREEIGRRYALGESASSIADGFARYFNTASDVRKVGREYAKQHGVVRNRFDHGAYGDEFDTWATQEYNRLGSYAAVARAAKDVWNTRVSASTVKRYVQKQLAMPIAA